MDRTYSKKTTSMEKYNHGNANKNSNNYKSNKINNNYYHYNYFYNIKLLLVFKK